MNSQKLSRLKLIGLFSAFAGPLLIASTLYFGQDSFEFGSTARGHLLPAGQTLEAVNFNLVRSNQSSETSDTPLLDGRWLLLFNGSASCDLYCQANMFKMRQARLVLGRNLKRVRTIYLIADNEMPDPALNQLLTQYPTFSVYRVDDSAKLVAQAPDLLPDQVYIVDPLGNLVMRYLPDAYSRHIIADFKQLLKVSKIG